MRAPIRYARSGDVNIAYQVTGGGDRDLVLVPGFVSHLELDWEDPRSADFLDGLGSFARLIRFDKRGTGLSDRPGGLPDLETRMDDVRAVMDAVGSERAALFGYSEGAPLCDPVRGRRAPSACARLSCTAGMPSACARLTIPGRPRRRSGTPTRRRSRPSGPSRRDMRRMCPSADEAMARWWESRARAAASPGAARALVEMNSQSTSATSCPPCTSRPSCSIAPATSTRASTRGASSPIASRGRASWSWRASTTARGSTPTTSWTRSSSSSPASSVHRARTGCSPRSCSRTSLGPPSTPCGSVTATGPPSCPRTTAPCVAS